MIFLPRRSVEFFSEIAKQWKQDAKKQREKNEIVFGIEYAGTQASCLDLILLHAELLSMRSGGASHAARLSPSWLCPCHNKFGLDVKRRPDRQRVGHERMVATVAPEPPQSDTQSEFSCPVPAPEARQRGSDKWATGMVTPLESGRRCDCLMGEMLGRLSVGTQ